MMSSSATPQSWVIAQLGDIAIWGSGGTPSRKKSEYYGGKIPWIKTGDLGPKVVVAASEFITEAAVQNSSAKFFSKGSVAIAMYGATIGKTSILGIDATTNQACAVGQPIPNVTTTDFLYYLLKSEKDNFIAKGKGGAQPNISQALIKEHGVLFPPLAEQKEIAARVDNLLAQVDSIKTRLDSIPAILKRFRQSVLAAAVSGKLTEEWRDSASVVNPLVQIHEFKEKLISSGGIKKSKQNNPLPFDDESEVLGAIPSSWKWARLISISTLVTDGKHGNCIDEDESGLYFLSAKDVKNGKLRYDDSRQINEVEFNEVHQRTDLEPGDICIVNTGATVGKLAIAEDHPLTKRTTFQKSVAVIKLIRPLINEKFVAFYLMDSNKRLMTSSSGSAVNNLLLSTMKQMPVPVAPVEEQTEIVRRVEQLFTFADQIEQRVKDAQSRVNNLTQSILAKAFRGELTADWREQNPDLISGENSAEALLEKIKSEREVLESTKKAVKRKKAKI